MSTFERVGWFVTGYTMIVAGLLVLVWTAHNWLKLDEIELTGEPSEQETVLRTSDGSAAVGP